MLQMLSKPTTKEVEELKEKSGYIPYTFSFDIDGNDRNLVLQINSPTIENKLPTIIYLELYVKDYGTPQNSDTLYILLSTQNCFGSVSGLKLNRFYNLDMEFLNEDIPDINPDFLEEVEYHIEKDGSTFVMNLKCIGFGQAIKEYSIQEVKIIFGTSNETSLILDY